MKKLGIISLLILLLVIGIYIFTSKETVKISELGGFRAENVDFSFMTLNVLDESSNETLYIDITHDIRKALTEFLLTETAYTVAYDNGIAGIYIGSLIFTDNDGYGRELRIFKDASNKTFINFPLNFDNSLYSYELVTDDFANYLLTLNNGQ